MRRIVCGVTSGSGGSPILDELPAGEASARVEHPLAHVALVPARPLACAEERALGFGEVAAANLLRTVGEQDMSASVAPSSPSRSRTRSEPHTDRNTWFG